MSPTLRAPRLAVLALLLGMAARAQAQENPGDQLQALYLKQLDAAVGEVKARGIREGVGNQLPLPPMGVRREVALKQVLPADVVQLRLLGHANAPLKLLMVLTGMVGRDTRDEVRAVLDVVEEVNRAAGMPSHRERLKLHLILGEPEDMHSIPMTAEELREHVEVDPYFATTDVWMQDWGEVGAALVRGADKERQVVLDLNRGRGLKELPERLARAWNGHYLKGPPGKGSGNYGGNVEVTPDDTLVIGDSSTEDLRSLLASLGYQGRTAVLGTRWLEVGHVDEFLSFLPMPETPLGYGVVVASPELGMKLLQQTAPRAFGASLKHMVHAAFRRADDYPRMLATDGTGFDQLAGSVAALHSALHGIPVDLGGVTGDELVAWNHQAAAHIQAGLEVLIQHLKGRYGASLEVPVIPVPALFKRSGNTYSALVPGVANMVVLRSHLLIPDPLLPEFQQELRRTLPAIGYQPRLIPNLTYHLKTGQLHCGTNTFRHPNRYVHPRYAQEAAARQSQARRTERFRRLAAGGS